MAAGHSERCPPARSYSRRNPAVIFLSDGAALIRPTAFSDAGVGRIRRLCCHPAKVSPTL
ncbi:hypothetical protein FDW96_22880 [Citrobacter sp. TBCS-15]|nr:hypothetical protein FDW96_22880 [Citrobacter sp. TBCS-15]TKU40651.1 hypothetical protein FDX11_22800 [Citrobacter sp. wls714]TKU74228.1 hypothetical protein FDX14_08985 [Citrobacter sp. wls710]TKU77170.1 hypothetical protein FDW92_07645 [Citrobacter sp. wls706]